MYNNDDYGGVFTANHCCGFVHHGGCFAQTLSPLECNRQSTSRLPLKCDWYHNEVTAVTVLKGSMRSESVDNQLWITYSLNISNNCGSRTTCSNKWLQLHRHICSFHGIRVEANGWPLINSHSKVSEVAPPIFVDLSGASSTNRRRSYPNSGKLCTFPFSIFFI